MKVRFRVSIAAARWSAYGGQVLRVPEDGLTVEEAKGLVKSGMAEIVGRKRRRTAVKPHPENAAAPPAQPARGTRRGG